MRVSAARLLGPLIAVVLSAPMIVATPASAAQTATLVRITDTSLWRRPSPDPMGLAYQRATGRILVVDSEVEETQLFAGANGWLMGPSGRARRALNTTSYSIEPTDVAAAPRGRAVFVVDDNQDAVFTIRAGPDRTLGTRDDRVSSFSTKPFGSKDPEGLGFGAGGLYITDGKATEVFRLKPGPNQRFDGIAPLGDDTVSRFDTLAVGAGDPEDIAYDAATGNLLLISRVDRAIVVTTTTGELIETIDLSFTDILYPAGIALAPGSDDPSSVHVYVADRGVDNDPQQGGGARSDENDGRVFEFALPKD